MHKCGKYRCRDARAKRGASNFRGLSRVLPGTFELRGRVWGVFVTYIMVRLLLIRHAAAETSENHPLLGSTDVSAGAEGLLELERLSGRLEAYKPERWFCSPMLRAVQTAERLRGLGLIGGQVRMDERLREIDFGRWELKSFAEIEASDPDLLPAWSGYDDFVFPGGEAVASFTGRVREMLDIFAASGDKEIGIITHGGVIRNMICLSLGISARHYLLFSVRPGSLSVIDHYPEGGVLAGLNL